MNAATKRAMQRALKRAGQDYTIEHVSYSETGRDEYEDPTTSETRQEVDARLAQTRNPWQVIDAADVDAHQKATVYVLDDIDITDETQAERPDEFHLDVTGDGTVDYTFKAEVAEYPDSGVIQCAVRLVD